MKWGQTSPVRAHIPFKTDSELKEAVKKVSFLQHYISSQYQLITDDSFTASAVPQLGEAEMFPCQGRFTVYEILDKAVIQLRDDDKKTIYPVISNCIKNDHI